jgi:hypothetical protein
VKVECINYLVALEGAKAHFSHYLNKWLAEPNKSIGKWMYYNHPLAVNTEKIDGPIDDDMVSVIASILGVDEEYLFRSLAYRLRGMWLRQEKYKVQPHPCQLRTFWYIEHEPMVSQVYGVVSRQVGEHCPGGGAYDVYENSDPEPPSFDMWISQQLYHTGYRNYGTRKNEMLYVHPLDVVDGHG